MVSVYGEDSLERSALGSITGAVPSNAGLDLEQRIEGDNHSRKYAADLAKKLLSRHPTYDAEVEFWTKYLDLYESKDIYRFIQRHLRETMSSWKKRVERGYYNNYVRSVVDLFTSYIYASPVDYFRGENVDHIFTDKFYKNVDFRGSSMKEFMMEVCKYTQVEGHVGILVDAPDLTEMPVISERDRISGDVRPYLTLLHAHQILDWELDDFGRFEWVKVCIGRSQKRIWDGELEENPRSVIIWSKDSWQVFDISGKSGQEKAESTRQGTNALGEVPLVICRFTKQSRHPWYGVSPISDIADINVAILNWSSLGDEEIFERCLNILTMESDGEDMKPELSHHNVLEYASGTKPPAYLIPGDTPLKLIREWIQFHIEDILRLAKLKGPTGMKDVRQATSGIAYAFEFNETNQTLSNRAEALESAEFEIHRLVAKYFGVEFTGSVAYPREFGVDDLLAELQGLNIGRQALTTETGIKELEKRVIKKVFAKLPTHMRVQMEEEIDEAEPKPTFDSMIRGSQPEELAPSTQEDEEPEEDETGEDTGEMDTEDQE